MTDTANPIKTARQRFRNYYHHHACAVAWDSLQPTPNSRDRCLVCDREITPYEAEEIYDDL